MTSLEWRRCSAASHRHASRPGPAKVDSTRLEEMSPRSRKTFLNSARCSPVYSNNWTSSSSEKPTLWTVRLTRTSASARTKSSAYYTFSKNTTSTTATLPSDLLSPSTCPMMPASSNGPPSIACHSSNDSFVHAQHSPTEWRTQPINAPMSRAGLTSGGGHRLPFLLRDRQVSQK